MNFYVNSAGIVLHVDAERIFQGSANANTIRFVGAFASSLLVTVAFRLPNGRWTEPQLMSFSAQLSGVNSSDGTKFNVWEYIIPGTVTEYFGRVDVQFFVHGSGGGAGAQIATALSSFEVERGVTIALPDPTDGYETFLTQILGALSQLQAGESQHALAAQKSADEAKEAAQTAVSELTNIINATKIGFRYNEASEELTLTVYTEAKN